MTYARKNLVSLSDTPYYHVVARCVRRAWLWGVDEYAGKDYSHRKAWVIERLSQLTEVFAIEVCAYAVMSNHYHLVLYVDGERAKGWSSEEVVARWEGLYGIPPLVERWLDGQGSEAEQQAALKIIERWRQRLGDLSWFMRSLNEYLARRANEEDECKGRFWEGRFRSQALLDTAGVLTAMAYVDLNPIRAGIAERPETSRFTSIYERIRDLASVTSPTPPDASEPRVRLLRFHGPGTEPCLPISAPDYLQLVDWTGRVIRADKRGAIDDALPPILSRLHIDRDAWCLAMRPQGNVFGRAIGSLSHLRLHARTVGQSWIRGLRQAERLYRVA